MTPTKITYTTSLLGVAAQLIEHALRSDSTERFYPTRQKEPLSQRPGSWKDSVRNQMKAFTSLQSNIIVIAALLCALPAQPMLAYQFAVGVFQESPSFPGKSATERYTYGSALTDSSLILPRGGLLHEELPISRLLHSYCSPPIPDVQPFVDDRSLPFSHLEMKIFFRLLKCCGSPPIAPHDTPISRRHPGDVPATIWPNSPAGSWKAGLSSMPEHLVLDRRAMKPGNYNGHDRINEPLTITCTPLKTVQRLLCRTGLDTRDRADEWCILSGKGPYWFLGSDHDSRKNTGNHHSVSRSTLNDYATSFHAPMNRELYGPLAFWDTDSACGFRGTILVNF